MAISATFPVRANPDTVRWLPTEQAVRDVAAKLNQQIMQWLRSPSGPPVPVGPVDVDDTVRQWHADRNVMPSETAEPTEQATSEEPGHQTSWWHRLTRRRRVGD